LLAAFELGGAEELVAASGGTAMIFEQSHKLSELISSSRIHLSSAHFFDSQGFNLGGDASWLLSPSKESARLATWLGPAPHARPQFEHVFQPHFICPTDIYTALRIYGIHALWLIASCQALRHRLHIRTSVLADHRHQVTDYRSRGSVRLIVCQSVYDFWPLQLIARWHYKQVAMSLASEFINHYVEYLLAPGILVTLLLVIAPLCYGVYQEKSLVGSNTKIARIPGCRRFGLPQGQSNLKDQFRESSSTDSKKIARIKALFTYPIKSCRGVELPASEVESTGLRYDRMFTFAQLHSKQASTETVREPSTDWQHEWRFITARELPRLALVDTELWVPDLRTEAPKKPSSHVRHISDDSDRGRSRSRKGTVVLESAGIDAERRRELSIPFIASDWQSNGGCLVISFPYEPDLNPFGLRTETVTIKVPLNPTPERAETKLYTTENVTVWKDRPQATNMTHEIDKASLDKLRYFLGVSKPLALFRRDDTCLRPVTRNPPDDLADGRFEIGFPDSYSAHILNVASVRALDASLPEDASMKGRLDARRFRANIYVDGPPAFAEDSWKRMSCGRCIQPRFDFSGERGRTAVSTDDESHPSAAAFLFGCGTSRCTLPNVEPKTGVKDKNEPYKTLMRTRKTNDTEPKAAFLGMQILPLFEYGIISVGDEIEVED
jgi:uncharacterized protein YcbX